MNISLFEKKAEQAALKVSDAFEHGWLGSSRFIALVAFCVGLYFVHTLFAPLTQILCAAVVVVYILANTYSKVWSMKLTAQIRIAHVEHGLADEDVAPVDATVVVTPVVTTTTTGPLPAPAAPVKP